MMAESGNSSVLGQNNEIDVNEAAAAAKRLASSTNSAPIAAAAAWNPYLFYSQIPPPAASAQFYQHSQIGGANGVNFNSFSNSNPQLPSMQQQQVPKTSTYSYQQPSYSNYMQPQAPHSHYNTQQLQMQLQNPWTSNGMANKNSINNMNSEGVDRVPRNPMAALLAESQGQGPRPIRFSLQQPGKRHAFSVNKPGSFGSNINNNSNSNNNNMNGPGNNNNPNTMSLGINPHAQNNGRLNKSRFSPAIGPIAGSVNLLPSPSTPANQTYNKQPDPQLAGSTSYGLANGSTWASASQPKKNISPLKQETPSPSLNECIKAENWSPSLKKYAERWFEIVFSTGGENLDKAQSLLEEKLEAAYKTGNFQTKDWTYEPLPILPNSGNMGYKTGLIPGTVSGTPLKPNLGSGILRGRGRGGGMGSLRGRSSGSPARAESFKSVRGRAKGIRGRNRFTSRSSSRSRSRSRSHSPSSRSSDSSGSYGSKGKKRKRSDSKGGKRKTSPSPKKKSKKEKGKKIKQAGKKTKSGKGHMFSEFGNVGGSVDETKKNARAERFAKEHAMTSNSKPKTIKSRLGGYAGSRKAMIGFVLDTHPDIIEDDLLDMSKSVIGTCTDLEKKYLRLTSMPDASSIRPVHILKKSLEMVRRKWKENENYEYACEQLKSIRQDLTVQRVRDPFTVLVYETHARIALEKGDHEEFNQCQSQLVQLYPNVLNATEHKLEFTAYRILYCIFTANTLDLGQILTSLAEDDKADKCIAHALELRKAWAMGNYAKFFKLHKIAPNMAGFLIDWFANRERKRALKSIFKAYRQSPLPISFLLNQLDLNQEGWTEFLKAAQWESAIIFKPGDKYLVDPKESHAALTALQPSA